MMKKGLAAFRSNIDAVFRSNTNAENSICSYFKTKAWWRMGWLRLDQILMVRFKIKYWCLKFYLLMFQGKIMMKKGLAAFRSNDDWDYSAGLALGSERYGAPALTCQTAMNCIKLFTVTLYFFHVFVFGFCIYYFLTCQTAMNCIKLFTVTVSCILYFTSFAFCTAVLV